MGLAAGTNTAEILDPEEQDLQDLDYLLDLDAFRESDSDEDLSLLVDGLEGSKLMDVSDIGEPSDEELEGIEADETGASPKSNDRRWIYSYNYLRHPLLSREEEKVVGERISKYSAEIEKMKSKIMEYEAIMTKTVNRVVRGRCQAEVKKLSETIARHETSVNAAVNRLVMANIRLVISIARQSMGMYQNDEQYVNDSIHEGVIGLIEAARRFDVQRGYKFSTYATWWVRQAINRASDDKYLGIRLPVHVRAKIGNMRRVEKYLTGIFLRPPTNAEIAAGLRDEIASRAVAFGRCNERFHKRKVPKELYYDEIRKVKHKKRQTYLLAAEAALLGRGIKRPEAGTDAFYHFQSLIENEIDALAGAGIIERAQSDFSDIGYTEQFVEINAGYVAVLRRAYAVNNGGSLNRPLGDTPGSREVIDMMEAPRDVDSIRDDEREKITELFVRAKLTDREVQIMRERFGFEDDEKRTLCKIGLEFNLSRERIRQLQKDAFKKIRRAVMRDRNLADALMDILRREG